VVVDSPERARARASLLGALAPWRLGELGPPVIAGANGWVLGLAAMAFVLVLALALTVARARALVSASFTLVTAVALAGGTVALVVNGLVPPIVAVNVLLPLALVAGLIDRVRRVERARAMLATLLDA
jgi:pheromone shutdown protein TraB